MSFKKRASMGIVTLVSAGSMLAAGSQSGAMAASHSPVTINVAAWNDAADSLKAEIPGFQKQFPWIKVNIQYVDGTYQKITPELVAGNAPDIIQTQQRDFPYFLNKFPGSFVGLNSDMGSIKNQIAKVALDVTMQNGTIYAAPWDLGPSAMYYRKDLFKKAGVNPKSIKTWADYLAAGKKITAYYHGKVKMLFENTSRSDQGVQGTTFLLLNELGGNFVNAKGQIDFTSPQMVKVMKTIQAWGKAGIVADAPTWNDGITSFSNGQVATIPSAVWYAGTMMNSAPKQKGEWGIMALPAFTNGGNSEANFGGSILAITKDSKNADAAWDFIKYSLYTVQGENVQLKYGLFPSWAPYYTAKGTTFNQDFPYFGMPIYKFFASASKNIPATNFGGYFNDYGKALSQAYISIFGGADIQSSLNTAAQASARLSGQPIASH
jgi:lactose/L-arabinose transport system substrate-binding protein